MNNEHSQQKIKNNIQVVLNNSESFGRIFSLSFIVNPVGSHYSVLDEYPDELNVLKYMQWCMY